MHHALAAIAEPRREQILRLVWRTERTAGEIAGSLPITFGAVSQHLKVLLAADLVTVRRDGRRRWYRANPAALGALAPALEHMWFGKLAELKRLAESEQSRIDANSARPTHSPPAPPRQHPPAPHRRDKREHR